MKPKNIVIGVTGGIACYKVLDLVKKLRKEKFNVHVIMTYSAEKLVDKKDFEKASGNKVQTSLFDPKINYKDYLKKNKPIKHIHRIKPYYVFFNFFLKLEIIVRFFPDERSQYLYGLASFLYGSAKLLPLDKACYSCSVLALEVNQQLIVVAVIPELRDYIQVFFEEI